MFKVTRGGHTLTYKSFEFSGGEVQVALDIYRGIILGPITIHADLTSSAKIMELALLVDAIRRYYGHVELHLICPYLPYARQDRVMNLGESLSVVIMASIINSLSFHSVTVWDPHSDVALAILHNVKVVEQHSLVQRIPLDLKRVTMIAPDAGAMKKINKSAKQWGSQVVIAGKTRSVQTGEITGTEIYGNLPTSGDFLIVDDICDGGRTFIELGRVLKQKRTYPSQKVFLYVTHGIFSQGLDVFEGAIDHIYVANPFPNVDLNNPRITKLNLGYEV